MAHESKGSAPPKANMDNLPTEGERARQAMTFL